MNDISALVGGKLTYQSQLFYLKKIKNRNGTYSVFDNDPTKCF